MAALTRRLGRFAALAGAALIVAGLIPTAAQAANSPKVAIIVGPSGAAVTERYRKAADAAADLALTLTPNVIKVYSPNATWPAVRAAVTGAAVVIYLGHGNGWPSPYGDKLSAKTMDGFGLNPVAGVDDTTHQYYGEAYVSRLALAPGAVVLFSHLCYASGSAEPGMADGTFTDVLARVDNFAAGFIAAGAGAVVAEGHTNPAALITSALSGPSAVAKAWTKANWGHGHITSYASSRSAGAMISLDPDKASSGYYRSIVRSSANASGWAAPNSLGVYVPPAPPSLASTGAQFGAAVVPASVRPSSTASIQLPITKAATALPSSLTVGVRWVPLVAAPADPDSASTDDTLVVGEASADLVETATATRTDAGLQLDMPTPSAPGTYVVLMTLEAEDGTPYDVATQALLRPFTMVVPKPVDLRITAPSALAAKPGTPVSFAVTLQNSGTQAWGSPLYASMWNDPNLDPVLDKFFSGLLTLNANWLDTTTGSATLAASFPLNRALGAPGHSATIELGALTPAKPGRYQLVLSLGAPITLGAFPQEPLLVPAEITVDAPEATVSPGPSVSANPGIEPAATATPSPSPAVTPPPTTSVASVPSKSRLALLTPCTSRPNCYVYTVRRGDTLTHISGFFGVSISRIRTMNPSLKITGLRTGINLRIPTPTR